MKLRVLDLFSGIGGFTLGLERTGGFETVAFCEIEPFCRRVLFKHWPGVPRYHDVRKLTADTLRRDGIAIDVICGGFPCQDISLAGKGAGIAGARSGLWKEYLRLVRELRPQRIIIENVAALLSRGLDVVLRDLAAEGYDAEWEVVSASDVGAPHRRERLWIQAYPHTDGMRPQRIRPSAAGAWPQQQFEGLLQESLRVAVSTGKSGGMVDGVPDRAHRLQALGNSIVPQIPQLIGEAILHAIDQGPH